LSKLEQVAPAAKSFKPLARFPSVNWDLAVLVPEDVAAGQLIEAVVGCGEKIIERAEIIDVFRGESIEPGCKSVAIAVTYRDVAKTLEDEAVQKVHQKIIDLIGVRFGGKLREA
jgi:phenylalanyl-tRNA synthetase beta chain